MADTTPMMSQYKRIKEKLSDTILFFRLGDFYEMFERDAREVSAALDLTLTQRNGVPMCGIPYHAASGYIARLLASGKKVAICEQSAAAGAAGASGAVRTLMNREVVEIITPGTAVDESYLSRGANNYLVAIGRVGERASMAYADVTTAEFAVTSFPWAEREERLRKELYRLEPKEVITQESLLEEDPVLRAILGEREGCLVNRYPDWSFELSSAAGRLKKQLGVATLKGFGLSDDSAEVASAGVLLEYLGETAKRTLAHISSLSLYTDSSFLELNETAQKSLELLSNLSDGSRHYTLLEVLDMTRTSIGARRMRRWILTPLLDAVAINRRLDAVEALYHDQLLLTKLREALGGVFDLERLASRVAMDRANAKDLLAIKETLAAAAEIQRLLPDTPALQELAGPLERNGVSSRELMGLIGEAITEDPSILLTEGNLIKRGFHAELDRLHGLSDNARGILESYLLEERAETGIQSLKLRDNRIIGHYFEVTKSNLGLVPPRFIRRQSLVGGERYTTERLADLESEINNASEKIVELERSLFLQVRAKVKEKVGEILAVAEAVSLQDVYQSLAFAATVHGYTRPRVTSSSRLLIREGRHPVVEANLPGGAFVPNTAELDGEGKPFVILTGPNMAGKSTYLRQTALIALMAQMGSFVPAAEAEIGIVDRIYSRVGATDNLARGESTFLVEMNETAHILRTATPRSLIIMDEIGRGTSTQDGLAIAWAVCLYILERLGSRTLFATHFHELTALTHPRLHNLSMDVIDQGGEVVFLKRVREGPSDNSYGIHVAKLAGLPREALEEAERILKENSRGAAPALVPAAAAAPQHADPPKTTQPLLFDASDMIIREIKALAVEKTTPLEALTRISRWKKELEG